MQDLGSEFRVSSLAVDAVETTPLFARLMEGTVAFALALSAVAAVLLLFSGFSEYRCSSLRSASSTASTLCGVRG